MSLEDWLEERRVHKVIKSLSKIIDSNSAWRSVWKKGWFLKSLSELIHANRAWSSVGKKAWFLKSLSEIIDFKCN